MNLTAIKNYLNKRKINIILSLAAFVSMWLIWIIAYYSVKNDYVVPSFSDTVISLGAVLASKSFWIALFYSLLRTVIAFILSFVTAVALVSAGAVWKKFNSFVKPFIGVMRTVPTLAVILILLFWTTPLVAPLIVVYLVLFPMIYSQLYYAVGDIDDKIIEMAEVYRIGRTERLKKIYLPQIVPVVLSETGANISLGIKIVISAEVLAGTYKSLGGLMYNARVYAELPRLAALTIIAVIIGLLTELCFSLIYRTTYKWRKSESRV